MADQSDNQNDNQNNNKINNPNGNELKDDGNNEYLLDKINTQGIDNVAKDYEQEGKKEQKEQEGQEDIQPNASATDTTSTQPPIPTPSVTPTSSPTPSPEPTPTTSMSSQSSTTSSLSQSPTTSSSPVSATPSSSQLSSSVTPTISASDTKTDTDTDTDTDTEADTDTDPSSLSKSTPNQGQSGGMQENTGEEPKNKDMLTVVFLVFLPPLGIILMWVWTNWKSWIKMVITLVGCLPFFIGTIAFFVYLISQNVSDDIISQRNNLEICTSICGEQNVSCMRECLEQPPVIRR